jgi:hypothetical protein
MTSPVRASRSGFRLIPAALFLLASAAYVPAASAQDGPAVELALAALSEVRETLPPGPSALDPHLLCSPRLAGWSCPAEVTETAESLGFTLHGRNFTLVCPAGRSSCRLVAARSLVHFSDPRVTGNAATLMLDVWWQTNDRTRPVSHRRARLVFERVLTGWVLVRTEPLVSGRS